MISSHTQRSIPVVELAEGGNLTHISGDSYQFTIPANPTTGVGPITSYWTAEAGEHGKLKTPTPVVTQASKSE